MTLYALIFRIIFIYTSLICCSYRAIMPVLFLSFSECFFLLLCSFLYLLYLCHFFARFVLHIILLGQLLEWKICSSLQLLAIMDHFGLSMPESLAFRYNQLIPMCVIVRYDQLDGEIPVPIDYHARNSIKFSYFTSF